LLHGRAQSGECGNWRERYDPVNPAALQPADSLQTNGSVQRDGSWVQRWIKDHPPVSAHSFARKLRALAPPSATGTRIPAIIAHLYAKRGFVDKTPYDTTSILKLITRKFNLSPLLGVRENAGDLSAPWACRPMTRRSPNRLHHERCSGAVSPSDDSRFGNDAPSGRRSRLGSSSPAASRTGLATEQIWE